MRYSKAIQDVINERKRQIDVEGWSTDHDDKYRNGELERAAACYTTEGIDTCRPFPVRSYIRSLWPWDWQWWKPKTHRQNLVRACALIIAAIELIDRQTEQTEQN